jgi:hypothetical protein
MGTPAVKARLTSSYDFLDEVEGIVELEVIEPVARIVQLDDVEIEPVGLDEVWDLL